MDALKLAGMAKGLDAGPNATALALSTSDLPNLMGIALAIVLDDAYAISAPTYRRIARMVPFDTFQPQKFLRVDPFPQLVGVGEDAEFKFGSIGDSVETASLGTWGKIVRPSRQLYINDRLEALTQLVQGAAARCLIFENNKFYSLCIAPNGGLGPNMGDGHPLFDAAHSNVTAGGALAFVTTLSSALNLIQSQPAADGSPLNAEGAILLVSPAYKALALSIIPVAMVGKLEVLADSNLSGARFYCFASPDKFEVFQYGGLKGPPAPLLETQWGFESDTIEFKVSLDWGCCPLDPRFGATGAGA